MNPSEGAPRAILDVVLRPHRSLSARGFWLLMALLCAISFVGGIVLWAIGAWPVIGFVGADIALVYVAFRASYARAHEYERLHLTRERLTIERVDHWGKVDRVELQPYWLRVDLSGSVDEGNRLALTSHGRSTVIGGFLAPAERARVAALLREGLAAARSG